MNQSHLAVTEFEVLCLGLNDDVAQGRTSRVVLTQHGRPVAALVPVGDQLPPLWGAMRGTGFVAPGVDLTEPSGEVWDADL